jgi:hypothetical protein
LGSVGAAASLVSGLVVADGDVYMSKALRVAIRNIAAVVYGALQLVKRMRALHNIDTLLLSTAFQ